MKKLITFVLVAIIISATLCGCGNTDTNNSAVTETDISTVEIDISDFKEVKTSEEKAVDIYRKEVSSRLKSLKKGESFISDNEWETISKSEWLIDPKKNHNTYFSTYSSLYKSTSRYYYPLLFRDGQLLILWYTTEDGYLNFEKIAGVGNFSGNGAAVHHTPTEGKEVLISTSNEYSVTYSQETGMVKKWEFGTPTKTYSVPKGSVYCGISAFEGLIFRNGTDILTLNSKNEFNEEKGEWETIVYTSNIAHNVLYVIDANYDFGSDPWSQPLFLMEDGSIKCYISWEGDKNSAPDDPSHLCDLQYEGGYHKGDK